MPVKFRKSHLPDESLKSEQTVRRIEPVACLKPIQQSGLSQLQRNAGNQRVMRLLKNGPGTAGDEGHISKSPGVMIQREERAWGDKNITGELAPGIRFVYDTFDKTVLVILQDGSGVRYPVEDKEGRSVMNSDQAEILSPIRVKALVIQNDWQGKYQENDEGRKKRLEYSASINKKMTRCNEFPATIGSGIANGDKEGIEALYKIDPSAVAKKRNAWRTATSNPEGPKPGDFFYLDKAGKPGEFQHVGTFRSRRILSGGNEIWTVVDGGQGGYDNLQRVTEGTQYYDKAKNMVGSAKTMTATLPLKGWIDIEAYFS